ncbi:MAG: hypothetical protein BGO41_01640 [Clostridiales bacterium 38-18]|nr:MAG: hypothetical protein BGO41_01640 [Clostridiales bacterium 38-18]
MNSDIILKYIDNSLVDFEDIGESDQSNFPGYMKNEYSMRWIKLFDEKFLLVEVKNSSGMSIEKLINRRNKLRELLNNNISIIFVFVTISEYLRKRLMEERIAFIIPGKQIFILEIGTIFNERYSTRYSSQNISSQKKLSPTAQSLLIYLLSELHPVNSMKELSEVLEVSLMSISRGYKELIKFKLVELIKSNDVNSYKLIGSKREVWNRALPYLSNPVQKNIYSKLVDNFDLYEVPIEIKLSGESALAEYSMLSRPNNPIYGVSSKKLNLLSNYMEIIPIKEPGSIEIQLFRHKLSSKNGVLNELSTALTLIDEGDERVRSEIDKMLDDYFTRRNE